MALLKTFCRCSSLRTGTIVAAIAGIILAIIGIIIIYTVPLNIITIVFDFAEKWIKNLIICISFVMTILISIVLLIGVVKRNMYLMIPWVVLGFMLAIGLLVSIIYTAVLFFIDGHNLAGALWLVFGLISEVIYIYMWMVVFSFFQIIKEESDRGSYTRPFSRGY